MVKRDKVSLLKHLQDLLFCESFDMQEETTLVICWSYVKCIWVSIINPKSLTAGAGVMISPKKFMLISEGRFCNSCREPVSRYLVVFGFISR